jgi:hypothetical protein
MIIPSGHEAAIKQRSSGIEGVNWSIGQLEKAKNKPPTFLHERAIYPAKPLAKQEARRSINELTKQPRFRYHSRNQKADRHPG